MQMLAAKALVPLILLLELAGHLRRGHLGSSK